MKLSAWVSIVGLLCVYAYAKEAKQVDKPVQQVNTKLANEADDLYLLDTIEASIYGEEETDIITKSDLDRPGIDGAFRSLNDRVIESLLYGEAKKFKMLPTTEAVEKHLQAVQQEHHLSQDELYDIFRAAGYSPQEGKEQFSKMSAISSVIDFKIRSRLIVPEKDIIAFYDENPIWQEPTYKVKRAVVNVPRRKNLERFRKELEQFIQTGTGSLKISWSDPFWINEDDIAEDRQFITAMEPGEIRIIQEGPEGFELLQLVEKKPKRLKPLEERYREIADKLRQPRFEELFKNYKQSLFDSASIIYFDQA